MKIFDYTEKDYLLFLPIIHEKNNPAWKSQPETLRLNQKIIDAQNIDFKDIKELIQLDEQKERLIGFLSPDHKPTEHLIKERNKSIQLNENLQNLKVF